MDTYSAVINGIVNYGRDVMVFDWHKAAEIIRDKKPSEAEAGLSQDWEWTGGVIYRDTQTHSRTRNWHS